MNIYTDGACSTKNQLASFGFWVPDLNYKEIYVVKACSNNYAELGAFICALKFAMKHKDKFPTIVTDSMYVKGGYESWMETWDLSTRKNGDLWTIIHDLKFKQCAVFPVRHCRGHGKGSGDSFEDVKGNDVIDKLVAKAVQP